ncbi:MAG: hypothetical protein VYD55_04045 [Chloroflexota bacterium]|nr:hypothetical protein [Chloroflexota bacterium]
MPADDSAKSDGFVEEEKNDVVKDSNQCGNDSTDILSMDAFAFIGKMANSRQQGNVKDKPEK